VIQEQGEKENIPLLGT